MLNVISTFTLGSLVFGLNPNGMCIDMAYLIWQPFTCQENGETILSHWVKASKDVTG